MSARQITDAAVNRCAVAVPQRGMNFHRTRACGNAATVQRGGKWYCPAHDPNTQGQRDMAKQTRSAQRDTTRRVLFLSKFMKPKARGLGEGKHDRIYWRDLGEKDKVEATDTGFGVLKVGAKKTDKRIPLFWHTTEA